MKNDSISRQAAIATIEHYLKHPPKNHSQLFIQGMDDAYYRTLSILRALPSAQPEIIRCKDCKHYRKEHGWNCIEYTVCAISPIHTVIRKPDDYCSRAKRKDDEKKNI